MADFKKFSCPVPGCVGEAVSKWGLRRHFGERHPHDLISLPGEGVYPKCVNCGMQTGPLAHARGHAQTRVCREGGLRRARQERRVTASLAVQREFEVYGDVLERVEVF